MCNSGLTEIERFDNLFNDDFIENATEEEIELCFDSLKKNCLKDNIDIYEVEDVLVSYCNSFITTVARV